jgi:hypothetical protein
MLRISARRLPFSSAATIAMDAIGSLGVDQMTLQRWIKRSAPLAAAVAVSAASVAVAQSPLLIGQPRVMSQRPGSELFEWTGSVDREVQIVMRGTNVRTNNVGQSERPRARTRSYNRLPDENGQVSVQMLSGRGHVDVIQQPSRQNDYTTIVRVRDDQNGSGDYRFATYWQAYSNGNGNGNGRDIYGNGRDNNDRDIYRGRDDNNNNRGNSRSNRTSSSEALHWTGNVDGDLEIRIQNGRVDYRNMSGAQPTNVRSNVGSASTRQNGDLVVQINQGRGNVDVVQQPQQWNGYTTIIRVRDPQGGAGYYDFSLVRR